MGLEARLRVSQAWPWQLGSLVVSINTRNGPRRFTRLDMRVCRHGTFYSVIGQPAAGAKGTWQCGCSDMAEPEWCFFIIPCQVDAGDSYRPSVIRGHRFRPFSGVSD